MKGQHIYFVPRSPLSLSVSLSFSLSLSLSLGNVQLLETDIFICLVLVSPLHCLPSSLLFGFSFCCSFALLSGLFLLLFPVCFSTDRRSTSLGGIPSCLCVVVYYFISSSAISLCARVQLLVQFIFFLFFLYFIFEQKRDKKGMHNWHWRLAVVYLIFLRTVRGPRQKENKKK